MQRFWLTFGGGLLVGIAMTLIGGFFASLILSEMPGGKREGSGAMAGMFFVGPLIGIFSLIAACITIWMLSADPAKQGMILWSIGGLAAFTVVGTMIALAGPPRQGNPNFKGVKGSVRFEVKFAAPAPAVSGLFYDLRKGGETLSGTVFSKEIRTEGNAAIIPGAFPLHGLEGFIIFGVMSGDTQRDVVSLDLPRVPEPTDWSEWKPMDQGSQVRWRVLRTN